MYDENLEKILTQAKTESDSFFSQTDYRAARNAVHIRIAEKTDKKAKPLWPFHMKAVFVAACFVAVIGIFSVMLLSVPKASVKTQGNTIAEEKVSLDEGKDGLLSYFTVKTPDDPKPGIMSVLWDTDRHNSQMLYSTVFNKCDAAYPASSLVFPDTGRRLVLIFSGSRQDDFIDYRIIGYDNASVKEWLSADFVQGGKLGIKDGLIQERRALPIKKGSDETSVTYIIPYDIGITGELALPVKDIQLRVGEQILLVGISERLLEVSSENGLFEKVESENNTQDENKLEYRATGRGNDVLLLKGENITGRGLNVNIVN